MITKEVEMVDKDIRIINRAVVVVEDQDVREAAYTALHHIANRLAKGEYLHARLYNAREEQRLAQEARDNWRTEADNLRRERDELREALEDIVQAYELGRSRLEEYTT